METPNPGAQAAPTGDPQAGDPTPAPIPTPTPAPAPAPTPTPTPAPGQTFDAAYVSALRNEAADARVKHGETKTALETASKERDALKLTVQNYALQSAISTAETKVADAEVALQLIDRSKIKFSADGKPENLNELLKALVEAKPFLAAGPGVPATPASNPARTGAKFTLEQVQAMSPAEINANWEAVQEVLKGN